jgi:large subunit ribosomal protein L21
MEFAVIQTGGKQYEVKAGDTIVIEKPKITPKAGDSIVFDKVLLVDDGKNTTIGTPFIKGAKVEGVVLAVGRRKKVLVVQYKAKSRRLKRSGHRQPFIKVKIERIK